MEVLGGHGLVEVSPSEALQLGRSPSNGDPGAPSRYPRCPRTRRRHERCRRYQSPGTAGGVLTTARGGTEATVPSMIFRGLLDAFARRRGDGGVLRLAADLVDLVDVDDALLGLLNIAVGLWMRRRRMFSTSSPRSRPLGQGGRPRLQRARRETGEAARQVLLPVPVGPSRRMLDLVPSMSSALPASREHALVVVVHGHRQGARLARSGRSPTCSRIR